MIQQARGYQARAKREVEKSWADGYQAVLLVAPSGSGKTFMGVSIVHGRVLWLAHRRELVFQAKEELEREMGRGTVGVIMSGERPQPRKRVQVASFDTLHQYQGPLPHVDTIVVDEAHHVMADTYRETVQLYPEARVLGLTATPERSDGRPLGDIFETMVVAADYSELIQCGDLVTVEVVRPDRRLTTTLARDPIESWKEFASGRSSFVFYPSVESAKSQAERFRMETGVQTRVIEANTPKGDRDDYMLLFRKGYVSVLCSVNALTEGVDVPTASVAISARSFAFVGTMIQCFGRVMRTAPGKARAYVIDLTGATHIHGLPHEDRVYSLKSDTPIRRANGGGGGGSPLEREPDGDVRLEIATLGEPPTIRGIDRWVRPSETRLPIPENKVRAISRKHGKRIMEEHLDAYRKME